MPKTRHGSTSHVNILKEVQNSLPGDHSIPGLEMDIEDLQERGLLTYDRKNPDDGLSYLESPTGINAGCNWTSDRKPKASHGKVHKGDYIYCPREYAPFMRAIFAGKNLRAQRLTWKEMLSVFGRARYALVEVRSLRSHKVWLGIFEAADIAIGHEKLLYLICSDLSNGMSYDFARYGVGEFELEIRGFFGKSEMALRHREIVINEHLDNGWASANIAELTKGKVKRFVSVEINFELVELLMAAVKAKRTRIKSVVTALVLKWVEAHRPSTPSDDPLASEPHDDN